MTIRSKKYLLALARIIAATGILFASPSFSAQTVLGSYTGISASSSSSGAHGSGAAGKTHLVQINDTRMKICAKSSTLCSRTFPITNIFSADPRCRAPITLHRGVVAYDPQDRFVVGLPIVDSSGEAICMAVSKTGDPNAGFHTYYYSTQPAITSNSNFETPYLGVWTTGYYMTFNNAVEVFAFNRDQMLGKKKPTPDWQMALLPAPDYVPATLTGTASPPANTPAILFGIYAHVETDPGHMHLGKELEGLRAIKYQVVWNSPHLSNLSAPTNMPFTFASLTDPKTKFALCPSFYLGVCVTQPNTEFSLGGNYGWLQGPVNYRNVNNVHSFLLTHNIDLHESHFPGDEGHAAVAWHEVRLNPSNGALSVFQTGEFSSDPHHRWAGSMAMNKRGDIGMVYNVSSKSIMPSIRLTGRLANDTKYKMPQGETTVMTSASVIDLIVDPVTNWGPNTMTIDPDGCTFWSFALNVTNGLWGTHIAKSKFSGCQ